MYKLGIAFLLLLVIVIGAYFVYLKSDDGPVAENATTTATVGEVSTTTISEETDLYRIDVVYPHFGIATIDTALDAKMQSDVASFRADAKEIDYLPTAKYEMVGVYDSLYRANDVVSARLVVSNYTGGAHPNSIVTGLNYNPQTGAAYTLADALRMIGMNLQRLSDEARKQLAAEYGEIIQFPEGANPTEENYSAFVIGKNDVTFYFQQYQVAAYAAGILKTSVPRK